MSATALDVLERRASQRPLGAGRPVGHAAIRAGRCTQACEAGLGERRQRLHDALLARQRLERVELARQEGREVLDAGLGHDHGVLVAEVEVLLRHPQLRVHREHVAGLQQAAVAADVVDGHADRVREDAAARLDQLARRRFVDRLREASSARRPRPSPASPRRWICVGRDAGPDARHHGVPVLEHELQQLALPGLVAAVDRPHPPDVAHVVVVVGRVVHQHQVARHQLPAVPEVVDVPDVLRARGGDRAVAVEPRVVHQEDVAAGGVELVLVDARLGAARRLHHAEPGELRRAADERDLARALDRPQLVQNGCQVLDRRARVARAQQLDEAPLARDAAVPEVVGDRGVPAPGARSGSRRNPRPGRSRRRSPTGAPSPSGQRASIASVESTSSAPVRRFTSSASAAESTLPSGARAARCAAAGRAWPSGCARRAAGRRAASRCRER